MLSSQQILTTKLENWRIKYISGTRKTWVYLSNEDEIQQWPLSDVDKFNLCIPIEDHIKMLKQPTTPHDAAVNAFRLLRRGQAPNGDWVGCGTDVMYLTPMYLFAFHILGFKIPEPQRIEQIRYILFCANTVDGGWGMAPGDESTVFGTALNYTSLRILGLDPDHPKMKIARNTLKGLGGALGASAWGKFWLCVLNVYDWAGVNSIPPELWALPEWLPVHPSKWYVFVRTFYCSMSYLFRVRFKAPITELTLALRKELYVEDYDTIDWTLYRNYISNADEHVPISRVMNVINFFLNGVLESCPIPLLNRYALNTVYQHVCYEVENTGSTCIVSCCSALNLIVQAHAEGVDSPTVQKQKESAEEYLWMSPEGMHVTISTSIPAWAGPFIGHALVETGLSELEENKESIIRLLKLLAEEQMTENTRHYPKDYRQMRKGGWVFGTKNENGYLLADCTGEAFGVILRLSHILKPEDRLPEWRLRMTVDLLLGMQSKDGGFPSYEAERGGNLLELINPTQEFDAVMAEYSTPEITASASTSLAEFKERYTYRANDIERCLQCAVVYLHASQLPSGGWAASWGICLTYGTFFALRALSRLANENYSNSECVKKACHFLLSHQRDDGGWGESRKGVKSNTYIQAENATMAQTAWATMALIYAKYPDKNPIERAVKKVMKEQQSDGSWPEEPPTGYAFRTFAIRYPLYRFIFPIWMLGLAHRYLSRED
ncbi:terpene synthase [Cyathus striatus]|nr:terpene synthase [Cyathus striatus]